MAQLVVTTSNYNSTVFWADIVESTGGPSLDFSALGSAIAISFEADTTTLSIWNGTTSFSVGDTTSGGGTNATLGGSTDRSFFSEIIGTTGNDALYGGAAGETIEGGAGNDWLSASPGAAAA